MSTATSERKMRRTKVRQYVRSDHKIRDRSCCTGLSCGADQDASRLRPRDCQWAVTYPSFTSPGAPDSVKSDSQLQIDPCSLHSMSGPSPVCCAGSISAFWMPTHEKLRSTGSHVQRACAEQSQSMSYGNIKPRFSSSERSLAPADETQSDAPTSQHTRLGRPARPWRSPG